MRIRSLLVSFGMLAVACSTQETTLGELQGGPVVINPTADGGTGTTTDAGLPCGWTQTNGFDTAVITAIAATDVTQVLAGTPHGLFRSTDEAQTWTRVTGFPEARVESLVIAGDTAFAVTEDDQVARHVYRSTDGVNWELADQGLEGAVAPQELSWTAGRLVLLTLGTPNNSWEWSTANQSWVQMDLPIGVTGYASNGTTEVVIADYGATVMYRTGGQGAFTDVTFNPPSALGFDRVWNVGSGFVMANASELYLSTDGTLFGQGTLPEGETLGPDAVVSTTGGIVPRPNGFAASFASGVYETTDGATWAPVGDADSRYFGHAKFLANDGTYLFGGTSEGVRRWTAGDGTWSSANEALQGADVKAMIALGPTVFASVGQDRLWMSTDSGQTWSQGPVLQNDAQVFALGLAGSDVYAGTDRFGIFRTGDDYGPFIPMNKGVPTEVGSAGEQFREVKSIAGNFDYAVAGLSNGAIRSVDRGANWVAANKGLPIIGTDSMNQPIFPGLSRVFEFNGVVLASSTQGGLYRSTDGAQNWTEASTGIPLQSGGVASNVTGLAKLGDTMFAGGVQSDDSGLHGVLLRSTNNGASWVDISSQLPAGFMVNDLTADTIQLYALLTHSPAAPADGVYYSKDGSSWQRLAGAPGGQMLHQISLPADWLLVGTAGHGVRAVNLTTCSF